MSKRAHHHTPRFYLSAFSDDEGFVHVYDKRERRQWKARPEEVGHVRDFYKIDVPELHEEAIEDWFAQVENAAQRLSRMY